MADAVKTSRPYVSPRRSQAARATREAILQAARRRFEQDGYVGTSMPAIAGEAEVAVKTVYLVFGSKPLLLRAVWEQRLAGEEAQVPVLERAWFRQIKDAGDPHVQLRLLAEQSRDVKARAGSLLHVIRTAAGADGDIGALWQDIEAKLLSVARAMVGVLQDNGSLRAEVSPQQAADAVWVLYHPSTWQLLVVQRGWSGDAYARWLERALVAELLDS
jgi:AcrR family transcriptional regulator